MPLSGNDPARDAEDETGPAAADSQPAAPRGRFGVADFPVDANLAAAAERALPTRQRVKPDEPESDKGRPSVVLWVAVAVVMVLVVGAAATFALSGGEQATGPTPTTRLPVPPSTTDGFEITVPPRETTSSTTTEPWVPPEPGPELIVYDSPGLIQPEIDLIEFRNESTVETLVLENNGGGAATWLLSVQAGSGLEVNPAEGQLKPGETVAVQILLDRENGRDLTDWAEDITMLGGGNTAPTSVRVKIFAL